MNICSLIAEPSWSREAARGQRQFHELLTAHSTGRMHVHCTARMQSPAHAQLYTVHMSFPSTMGHSTVLGSRAGDLQGSAPVPARAMS
jgi:hypothetical protein